METSQNKVVLKEEGGRGRGGGVLNVVVAFTVTVLRVVPLPPEKAFD